QGRDWSHPANWLFIACCFVTLVGLHFVLIAPFAFRWIARVLLSLLVIVTAAATYFMHTFAVMLDPTMIQNVLRTDWHEARELLNWSLLGWVLAWSLLPLAFIWLVHLAAVPPLRALAIRAACVLGALLIAVLAVLPVSRDFTSLMRNQKQARYLITPGNLIYGLVAQSMKNVRDVNAPREVIGADAHLAAQPAGGNPRVLVLVLGETVRAANFSLLGGRRHRVQQRALLWNRNRGVGAVHVLAVRPGALRRAAHQELRGFARCAQARRVRGEVAPKPVRVQGRLPGSRITEGRRVDGARPVFRRRVPGRSPGAPDDRRAVE